MLRIGLTGGIGSGKSTVASLLAAKGAAIIDADAISRNATASNGAAIAAIEAEFGAGFITAERAMDRSRMRDLVFQDQTAKSRLESIIHPLVGQQIQAQALEWEIQGKACAVFDIPLLVESGHWRKSLDRILVVDCTPATQIVRVSQRNNISAQEVERIIASQASRQSRLCAADLVLYNDGVSLDALALEVQEITAQFGL